MTPTPDDPLDRALAALHPEIMPPRNLWPGISARIGHLAPRGPSYLMAACVALVAAGLASVFTWTTLRHAGNESAPPVLALAGPFAEPSDPHYVAAKADLERTFNERLTLLAPATRAQIEASLMVIRDAHESIRRALLEDPSSAVLESLWQSSWQDEIDLYDHVVQITDTALPRSSI